MDPRFIENDAPPSFLQVAADFSGTFGSLGIALFFFMLAITFATTFDPASEQKLPVKVGSNRQAAWRCVVLTVGLALCSLHQLLVLGYALGLAFLCLALVSGFQARKLFRAFKVESLTDDYLKVQLQKAIKKSLKPLYKNDMLSTNGPKPDDDAAWLNRTEEITSLDKLYYSDE